MTSGSPRTARMLIGACLIAAAAVASPSALAQCAPLPPDLAPATPALAGFVVRYNALVASDPYLKRNDTAPPWRALIADLRGSPATTPDLLARSLMMLSQSDVKVAEGLDAAREARSTAEAEGLGDTSLHAEILTALAFREVDNGKAQDAVRDAEAAVAESTRAFGAQSWPVGHAYMALTSAYHAYGRASDAERSALLARNLALSCLPATDQRIAGRIATHAVELATAGRLEEALVEDEHALVWAVSHLTESDATYAYLLDNYGMDLRNAGRLREAETVLRRAIDLAARFHPDNLQRRGSLLGKFGNVLEAEGRHREAEAMWLQALEMDRKVEDLSNPLIGSGELRRAADAAQARGDLPLTLARREQAIALMAAHAQPRHPELARARLEYASTLALAGRAAEARAIADPAVAIVRDNMPEGDFKRMGAEIAYAQIVALASGPDQAYPIAAPVTQRLERTLLDSATARGDLIRFAPLFSGSFAAAARFALARGHEDEAFHDLQLANLSDVVLVNANIAARAAAADPAARAAVTQLQQRVATRGEEERERVRLVAAHDPAGVARIEQALAADDATIAGLTGTLDRVFPAYRQLGRPLPASLAAVMSGLGRDDILIAPLALPGETVTIAVTRAGLAWASTPTPRWQLMGLVTRIRAAIDAGRHDDRARFDVDAAHRLYQLMVPAPIAPLLRNHRHILYYASGALATIPPALLVVAPPRKEKFADWLVRTHSISVVTTLTPRRAIAAAPGRSFLGIGAPRTDRVASVASREGAAGQDFGITPAAPLPSLPYAQRELRAIARWFPASARQLLIGVNATRAALRELPPQRYQLVAIATHGLVADARPGLTQPALVMTPDGDDGLLTASDVAGLSLDADWVILSACDTASGSDPQAGSYSGLASAFLQAGARALLVSHWPVRDDAAARLTVATLSETKKGRDRATALQNAMLALMRDRAISGSANPAIWAPFVLVER